MAGVPGTPLPRDLIRQLAAVLRELGEPRLRKLGGLSHVALARALAALPVRRGTRALVERLLEKVAEMRRQQEAGQ